jgi:nucleoside-diphosphate-sugar epimerase
MKILLVGNMGYVGPVVVGHLREAYPGAILIGFDMGYFAHCLSACEVLPERHLHQQYFGDVRYFPEDILTGVDRIVYLAAISNDPMGAQFERVTLEVNQVAAFKMAELAKQHGVRSFVYASSCSVYGAALGQSRTEEAELNPLTVYAKSKVGAERALEKLADHSFTVTCLRFATACGMSSRLRLDLVLNDFVASALVTRKISILSDGTPWRPLIHVRDMARAIEWSLNRHGSEGGQFLTVNIGSNHWNYRVKDLADAVAEVIPGIEVCINSNAPPDKRSYQVSFDKFSILAPRFLPRIDLIGTIHELKDGLKTMAFGDVNFRDSELIRLNVLRGLIKYRYLDDNLSWQHD